ncbi:hypothetical protein GCM10010267_19920 [Streptomyces griseorubens]|nr:hypothetical protein GCM10010267_19920 [Streptomyces griseorubens]
MLLGGRVGHGEAGGQWGRLQRVHLPSAVFQAGAERGGDVGHGRRVLGGDVEVLAGAVDEAVCPHGISAGEDQGVYGEPRAITSARSRVCSSGLSVTRLPGCGR